MEVITSLDNKRIKNLSKLLDKKYRDIESKFLIEGEHLVEEAYKNGVLEEVICTEEYNKKYDVKTTYVSYQVIKKLTKTECPQQVVGVVLKKEGTLKGNKYVLLDAIQDPGNMGTIIRSAVAFGIDTIVVGNDSVDIYNDKVLRASEGMIFHINIVKKDMEETIKELHKNKIVVYGTKVSGGLELKKIEKNDSYAVLVGNEGAGVREKLLSLCDKYLYIPMKMECESLNVGVATSIILYELNR